MASSPVALGRVDRDVVVELPFKVRRHGRLGLKLSFQRSLCSLSSRKMQKLKFCDRKTRSKNKVHACSATKRKKKEKRENAGRCSEGRDMYAKGGVESVVQVIKKSRRKSKEGRERAKKRRREKKAKTKAKQSTQREIANDPVPLDCHEEDDPLIFLAPLA